MKVFGHLSFVAATALAGFLTLQAAPANSAEIIKTPMLPACASSLAAQDAYYYYHGRRYPYRYHGLYFNHRYYRGGYYHYY